MARQTWENNLYCKFGGMSGNTSANTQICTGNGGSGPHLNLGPPSATSFASTVTKVRDDERIMHDRGASGQKRLNVIVGALSLLVKMRDVF